MNEYCAFCGGVKDNHGGYLCKSCIRRDRVEMIIYLAGCLVALAAAAVIAATGPDLVMGWFALLDPLGVCQ